MAIVTPPRYRRVSVDRSLRAAVDLTPDVDSLLGIRARTVAIPDQSRPGNSNVRTSFGVKQAFKEIMLAIIS